MKSEKLKPESKVNVDIASGICVGIQEKANQSLFRLGFIFIKTIKFAELTNVVYLNYGKKVPKMNVTKVKSMSYQNSTSETQEYTFETSKKLTQTSSWSVTRKLGFLINLEVNAGIPMIVDGKGRFEFNIGNESTYNSQPTEERTESFSVPLRVPPGKTVNVCIEIAEAKVNLPFTGIIKITCSYDSMVELKTSGTYKGVTYSDGKVIVNESKKNLDWS